MSSVFKEISSRQTYLIHLFQLKMLNLVLVILASTVLVAQAQRQELSFQNGNYVLGWEVNAARTSLTVDATVKTTGYVGFGVSNREGPGMEGSDIIVAGYQDSDGARYFGDFFSTINGPPTLDTRQDGTLLEARQTDGVTFVKFERLLVTGDPNPGQDVDISTSSFLLWSYGDGDVVNYHNANRGKVAQSLLAPAPPQGKGIQHKLPVIGF